MEGVPLPLPLLVLLPAVGAGLDLDLARCRFALGMQDGSIPDSHLSASSSWSDSTAAQHGRLGRNDGDGAWCPAGPVFPDEEEFLQVDLGHLHLVTLVGTQGRHAGGHGKEFAQTYRLRYSRDRNRWLPWRDRWGTEVIGGNEDPQGVVLKDLSPPLVAVALRVHPRAPRAMSVCLRLELYGCPWDAGLLSYTTPRGHTMSLHPTTIVLNDSTYDGDSVGPLLYGGLGQLTDGVLGLDDFTRSRERRLWPGYDYVGWRRPPGPQPRVELEFEFEQLRMFHAMQVHCNNMHTRGVSIFAAVECGFKNSLEAPWEPPAAPHHPEGTTGDPRARWVAVPLGGRRARFVRCRFLFAGEWMLFSEVNFVSDVVEESMAASGGSPAAPPETPLEATNHSTSAPWEPKAGQPVAKEDHSHTSILIGCLVAIILLLLAVIVLILWRHHWRKILGKAQRRPSEEELRVQLSVPGDTVVINNTTGGGWGPPRYERIPPGLGEYQEPTRPPLPPVPPVPGPAPPTSPFANPAYRLLLATYAQPIGGLARDPPDGAKPINTDGVMEPEVGAGAYAEADVTGGSAYALAGPAHCPGHAPHPTLPAFPRGRLRFREKLGEGQFGEVLLCEVEDPQELPPPSRPAVLPHGRPLLVAVKVLRPDASKNARRDFLQEARTLGRLRDPNIVRLLGVCSGEGGPLCIITEYMEHGDLHRFLGGPCGPTLSLRTLLHVGAQIASGMRFLARLNFVHRDLATRNCLVGDGFTVKVADFGMSRHLYGAHYYRVRGRALLPIRWMAWECILLGTFTPASDAWAFGVTLWEVLTRCREQPYGALSDEQVIANAGRHCRGHGEVRRPPPTEEVSLATRLLLVLLAVVSVQVYSAPAETVTTQPGEVEVTTQAGEVAVTPKMVAVTPKAVTTQPGEVAVTPVVVGKTTQPREVVVTPEMVAVTPKAVTTQPGEVVVTPTVVTVTIQPGEVAVTPKVVGKPTQPGEVVVTARAVAVTLNVSSLPPHLSPQPPQPEETVVGTSQPEGAVTPEMVVVTARLGTTVTPPVTTCPPTGGQVTPVGTSCPRLLPSPTPRAYNITAH